MSRTVMTRRALSLASGLSLALALCAALVLTRATAAYADEGILNWDDGTPATYEFLQYESHFVKFFKPDAWQEVFPVEVSFYGQRYGEVGDTRATVVIWGPKIEVESKSKAKKTVKLEKEKQEREQDGKHTHLIIYASKQFPLSLVPAEPGWVSVGLDAIELPEEFAVSIFTCSTEENGIKLALTGLSDAPSFSSSVKPELSGSGNELIKYRTDGCEWMIRLKVRTTLAPEISISADQLTGEQFSTFDDGQADGFVTMQKSGALLHIKNPGQRVVKRVYVYGQAGGQWFNTGRQAGVYLLDRDLKIIERAGLPYNKYTNQPAWHFQEFDNVRVPGEFYVLVEPASRASVQLMLGYDGSSANKASLYGTIGAQQTWRSEAPEETTNWMIRVEYAK